MKKRQVYIIALLILCYFLCGCGSQPRSIAPVEAVVEQTEAPVETVVDQTEESPTVSVEEIIPSGVMVYITKEGDKYHKEDCSSAQNNLPIDIYRAIELGYEPCSLCRPPLVTEDGEIQEQESLRIEDRTDYVSKDFDPRDVPLEKVESSNLSQVGYDKEERVLVIEFNSGGLYAYYDVPETVVTELLDAESLGSYFYANIRNQYKNEKLSE